ncbi:MAG: hypothetical protein JWM66_846 [Solirubrobacterales bacterium]|jgi:hypothetical protein|nr:hypothetical protein [Solirubrobacterales bacterium]
MLAASMRERPNVLHAPGERVALALELREAEQARSARRVRRDARRRDGNVGERRRDELRELSLQARDLRAQRSPRRALADLLARGDCSTDRQLLQTGHAYDSSCRRRERRFYQRASSPRAARRRTDASLIGHRPAGTGSARHGVSSAARQLHSASSTYSAGTPSTCTANSARRSLRARGA